MKKQTNEWKPGDVLIVDGRSVTDIPREGEILEVLGDTHGALTHQAHALDYMRRLGDRRSTAELLLGCARMTGDLPPVVASTSKKSLEATRRSRERAKKAMEFAQELASEIGWDEGAKLAGAGLPQKGPRST